MTPPAVPISAFCRAERSISASTTRSRRTGRRAASVEPRSPSAWASARAIASTGNPEPLGTRTTWPGSTYGGSGTRSPAGLAITATAGTARPFGPAEECDVLRGRLGDEDIDDRSGGLRVAALTHRRGHSVSDELAPQHGHEPGLPEEGERPLVTCPGPQLARDREHIPRVEHWLRAHGRGRPRTWIASSTPTATRLATSEEPPTLTNGRVIPVTGAMPIVIPTFTKIWKRSANDDTGRGDGGERVAGDGHDLRALARRSSR